jgi:hypothetical protein
VARQVASGMTAKEIAQLKRLLKRGPKTNSASVCNSLLVLMFGAVIVMVKKADWSDGEKGWLKMRT